MDFRGRGPPRPSPDFVLIECGSFFTTSVPTFVCDSSFAGLGLPVHLTGTRLQDGSLGVSGRLGKRRDLQSRPRLPARPRGRGRGRGRAGPEWSKQARETLTPNHCVLFGAFNLCGPGPSVQWSCCLFS